MASADNDGTIRLWPTDASPEMLCAKLTANLSNKQWQEWISADADIGYQQLCPRLPTATD